MSALMKAFEGMFEKIGQLTSINRPGTMGVSGKITPMARPGVSGSGPGAPPPPPATPMARPGAIPSGNIGSGQTPMNNPGAIRGATMAKPTVPKTTTSIKAPVPKRTGMTGQQAIGSAAKRPTARSLGIPSARF